MLESIASEYRANLEAKLALLPNHPGVYLHKNATGDVIYVGKAISLKNRVRQYFQSSKNHSEKVVAMVKNIADFDYILTETETEALTLESNLIKQYQPHYNILLKDDKNFPYVRINLNDPYPRVDIVHKVKKDGAKYFGPYLSKKSIRDTLDVLQEIIPLRTCSKDIPRAIQRQERPCLNYYIHRCIAPCTGAVSSETYRALVDEVIDFLHGNTDIVVQRLRIEMAQASDEMAFERAAMLRDRIRSIELLEDKQKAITTKKDEYDVFATQSFDHETIGYVLLVRKGKIVGAEPFSLVALQESEEDIMSSFIRQFYASGTTIPREIYVHCMPSEVEETETWLSQLCDHKVTIAQPQRGQKRNLVDMAQKNAQDQLQKQKALLHRQWERTEGAVDQLAESIGLESPPKRIECFDISHTAGTDPVASMIVFENGQPNKKAYRRFRIRTAQNDDYASMREVLSRRFKRGQQERENGHYTGFGAFPDLLIVDGGKGQLHIALDVLQEFGIADSGEVNVIGLSEKMEEIWLPHQHDSILLHTSPALHLIQRIRDEAHRFAITYHRSLRSKTALFSLLDEINGIGAQRKRILFAHFVSLDAIKTAPIDELKSIKGMTTASAQAVYDYFHQD